MNNTWYSTAILQTGTTLDHQSKESQLRPSTLPKSTRYVSWKRQKQKHDIFNELRQWTVCVFYFFCLNLAMWLLHILMSSVAGFCLIFWGFMQKEIYTFYQFIFSDVTCSSEKWKAERNRIYLKTYKNNKERNKNPCHVVCMYIHRVMYHDTSAQNQHFFQTNNNKQTQNIRLVY